MCHIEKNISRCFGCNFVILSFFFLVGVWMCPCIALLYIVILLHRCIDGHLCLVWCWHTGFQTIYKNLQDFSSPNFSYLNSSVPHSLSLAWKMSFDSSSSSSNLDEENTYPSFSSSSSFYLFIYFGCVNMRFFNQKKAFLCFYSSE